MSMSMEGRLVLQRGSVKERGREIRIGKEKEKERGKGNGKGIEKEEKENGKEEDINRIRPCSINNFPNLLPQSQLLLRLPLRDILL